MIAYLKKLLRGPTDLDAAATELSEAYLELLTAQTGVEYSKSMVDYNVARIDRLEAYLAQYREQK